MPCGFHKLAVSLCLGVGLVLSVSNRRLLTGGFLEVNEVICVINCRLSVSISLQTVFATYFWLLFNVVEALFLSPDALLSSPGCRILISFGLSQYSCKISPPHAHAYLFSFLTVGGRSSLCSSKISLFFGFLSTSLCEKSPFFKKFSIPIFLLLSASLNLFGWNHVPRLSISYSCQHDCVQQRSFVEIWQMWHEY